MSRCLCDGHSMWQITFFETFFDVQPLGVTNPFVFVVRFPLGRPFRWWEGFWTLGRGGEREGEFSTLLGTIVYLKVCFDRYLDRFFEERIFGTATQFPMTSILYMFGADAVIATGLVDFEFINGFLNLV